MKGIEKSVTLFLGLRIKFEVFSMSQSSSHLSLGPHVTFLSSNVLSIWKSANQRQKINKKLSVIFFRETLELLTHNITFFLCNLKEK